MGWPGSRWWEPGSREVDEAQVCPGGAWMGLWAAGTRKGGRSRGQERLPGYWSDRARGDWEGADWGEDEVLRSAPVYSGGGARGQEA